MAKKKNLIFSVVTIVILFVIIETFFQCVYHIRRDTEDYRLPATVKSDSVLHHSWIRDKTTLFTLRGNLDTLTVNKAGFVAKNEFSKNKSKGVIRGLFIGDSNIQGVVSHSHKLVTKVEAQLNKKFGNDSLRFELINCGTSSYSPLIYYVYLKDRLLEYNPDFVFIAVDMTDLANDFVYKEYVELGPDSLPIAVVGDKFKGKSLSVTGVVEESRLEKFSKGLTKYSKTAHYLKKVVNKVSPPEPAVIEIDTSNLSPNWLVEPWSSVTEEAFAETSETLINTFDLLKSNGIKVYLTGVPHYPQFSKEWSSLAHARMEELAIQEGVPYLNTFELIFETVSSGKEGEYYFLTDPTHFNEKGNGLWAEHVNAFLNEHFIKEFK